MTTLDDMIDAERAQNRGAVRLAIAGGVVAVLLLAGGFGGWAATTDIAGAVIAPGRLVVDTDVKKVQHPTGGVVGELFVREGDRVRRGDLMLRLDDTMTQANLAIVIKSLDQFQARRARLGAERDGAQTIPFPDDLVRRAAAEPSGSADESVRGERRLFETRRELRAGRKDQLRQRTEQMRLEIAGTEQQRLGKQRQLELIEQEIRRIGSLVDKQLVELSRRIALEREQAELAGQVGNLTAQIAQVQGKIAETELQIIGIDQEMSEQVGAELREIDVKIGEYVERRIAAEDQLRRVDVRAPDDGIVHQLGQHTVGGVVTTNEPVALIVPVNDELTVDARIQPQDVDQVFPGQAVMMRLSAFNQRTTPEVAGQVERISADVSLDQRTGATYYVARIRIARTELPRLGRLKLVAGMPVETFVQTGERSVASYLVKPLLDQIAHAFREDS